jgi:hypothetical protein
VLTAYLFQTVLEYQVVGTTYLSVGILLLSATTMMPQRSIATNHLRLARDQDLGSWNPIATERGCKDLHHLVLFEPAASLASA